MELAAIFFGAVPYCGRVPPGSRTNVLKTDVVEFPTDHPNDNRTNNIALPASWHRDRMARTSDNPRSTMIKTPHQIAPTYDG